MDMKIVMRKQEAEKLLAAALKPTLGAVEFKVEMVTWASYSDQVAFELTSVEPPVVDEVLTPVPSVGEAA